MMYTEKHVIPLFLKASSGWEEALNAERASWDSKSPGLYNEISVLASYIVNSYQDGKVDAFPKIFSTLEILIQEGDERTRELVIVGLIEGIQNKLSSEFGSSAFKKWLKEESLKSWNEIEKFWMNKKRATDGVGECEGQSNGNN